MRMLEDPLGLVGTKLDDKYLIESVVGEGGFAVVYRATHLLLKRPVAIKAFRTLSDFGPDAREQLVQEFMQEGRLLAELSEKSAAIVQSRDIGSFTTATGTWVPYMVLEWLEGETLEAVLVAERESRSPPRSFEQTVALLDPIAEALALAHRSGIAHRDVKPGNVFLTGAAGATPVVKLLDFGIAKVVQDVQKSDGSFQKTKGHLTSFTPTYGAPEQFSRTHGPTGPWTDVFALALLVTEVATGQPPLDGETFVQLGFASADTSRRPTPRALGLDLGDAVEAVLAKAVAVSVESRYQSAGEFWSALREAAALAPRSSQLALSSATRSTRSVPMESDTIAVGYEAGSAPALPPAPPVSSADGARRGRGTLLAGVAAVAAVGVLGAVLLSTSHKVDVSTVASSSASAVASVAPAPPAAPSCGAGQILVSGGEFFMGSADTNALENEKPAHSVVLSPFCIDRTEVTVSAYLACSTVGKCAPASKTNDFADLDDTLRKTVDPLCNVNDLVGHGSHPINCVDWDMASNYCQRQGGRLPTEAEWEFAARGPDGRAYPWGDDPPSGKLLNACGSECSTWGKKNHVEGKITFGTMYPDDDTFATTAPVGSFPKGASRYGLEDVVGNVWEWTADYFAPYTKDAAKDPHGPASSEDGRVARGGAWNGPFPSWVRPTFRFHFLPENRSYGVGFRCAGPVR